MSVFFLNSFSSFSVSEHSLEHVYIGQSSDFFMGDNYLSVILAAGLDVIFVNDSDTIDVMNDIIIIFDKYRTFDEKVKSASMTNNPFQDMLDVIHELFQCPMFFGQKDLRIYALTKQYSDDEVYEGWDDVKKYYTMPIKLINTTIAPDMTKYPDTIKTVAIPVSEDEGKHFKYQIRSNVYCNKKLWGHLYIYYNNQAIPMSVIQLARFCADAYGHLLNRLAMEDSSSKYKKYTYLADILDGKDIATEKIENLRWQMGWGERDKLRLYKVSFVEERYSEMFFDFALMTIDSNVNDEIVFPYRKNIIIITKDVGKKLDGLFAVIKRVMSNNDYVCGGSYPFDKLSMVSYAYFQAGFAISFFEKNKDFDENYFYYDDCAFPGLITYVRENFEYKAFMPPALFELYDLDKSTGTEYYKTLFWLLVNNGHAANAAKKLFIHRNTLKYRIDKILQIINVDINDSDVIAYLRICYSLMMVDYPIETDSDCEEE